MVFQNSAVLTFPASIAFRIRSIVGLASGSRHGAGRVHSSRGRRSLKAIPYREAASRVLVTTTAYRPPPSAAKLTEWAPSSVAGTKDLNGDPFGLTTSTPSPRGCTTTSFA